MKFPSDTEVQAVRLHEAAITLLALVPIFSEDAVKMTTEKLRTENNRGDEESALAHKLADLIDKMATL